MSKFFSTNLVTSGTGQLYFYGCRGANYDYNRYVSAANMCGLIGAVARGNTHTISLAWENDTTGLLPGNYGLHLTVDSTDLG